MAASLPPEPELGPETEEAVRPDSGSGKAQYYKGSFLLKDTRQKINERKQNINQYVKPRAWLAVSESVV